MHRWIDAYSVATGSWVGAEVRSLTNSVFNMPQKCNSVLLMLLLVDCPVDIRCLSHIAARVWALVFSTPARMLLCSITRPGPPFSAPSPEVGSKRGGRAMNDLRPMH